MERKGNKGSLAYAFIILVVFVYQEWYDTCILFLIMLCTPMIRRYMGIFLFTVTYTMILYYSYNYYYGNPYFIGGSDDVAYELDAEKVKTLFLYSKETVGNEINKYWHNSLGYVYLISRFQLFGDIFGGYSSFTPRLFNNFLLIFQLNLLNKSLKNFNMGLQIPSLVLLTPLTIFISAHVFRDTLISTFLVYYAVKLLKVSVGSIRILEFILVSILIAVCIYQLRMLYVIPVLFMTVFVLIQRSYRIVRFIAIPLVLLFLYVSVDYSTISQGFEIISHYSDVLNERSDGLSSIVFNQPGLKGLFLRLLYVLFVPFPFNFTRWWFMLNVFHVLVFWAIVIELIIERRFLKLNKGQLNLFIFTLLIFSGFIGATFTFRHILAWWPLLVFAIYLSRKSIKYRIVRNISVVSLWVLLNCVYFLL